ncbi:MAG: 30S ribosomal protein S1 [Candidatus Makana argininalis]
MFSFFIKLNILLTINNILKYLFIKFKKNKNMIESFSQLLEKSMKEINIKPGSIIKGNVISILKDVVVLDTGLKSESVIKIEQFLNSQGELEIKIGDKVDVSLDALEDGFGETLISREKAKRHEDWLMLEKSYEKSQSVIGTINGKVKGGFTVEINNIRAFLPGSLVDIRPLKDTINLEGKNFDFKVIKIDKKRNNIVVSRKAIIENENNIERNKILKTLKEGEKIKGIVKNITDYGAFIDMGGIDGLLHITDISWRRIKHPSEVINIGDKITVKILKFDKKRTRVSLGLKQLGIDPWISIANKYPKGCKKHGIVTNLTDYGCFVEIEEGIEGLVHISEMDWINKNIHPSKVVKINDNVEIMILNIEEKRRRISLGLKQCKINPWKEFSKYINKGDIVKGKVKSITDFGIFVGLDKGVDGLVHLSDISWKISYDKSNINYKKGENISCCVLQVDPEKERISLGIKQLNKDPFKIYLNKNKNNSIVKGKIISFVKGLIFKLDNEVEGYLNNFEILNNKFKNKLKLGDFIKIKISGYNIKNRIINLKFI